MLFRFFFSSKEIITYKNYSDLVEKINKYKRNDKDRKKIAKNGKLKYLKFFNSRKVAKFILNKTYQVNDKESFLVLNFAYENTIKFSK